MNKRLRLFLFLALSFAFQLSYAAESQVAIVKGKISQPIGAEVTIFRTTNGSTTKVATYIAKANAEFVFALPLTQDAFCSISVKQIRTRDEEHKNKPFKKASIPVYVKAGSEMELNITPDENNALATYQVVNESPENKVLHDWYILAAPVTLRVQNDGKPISWSDYYAKYQQLLPAMQGFEKKVQVKDNPGFTELMKVMVDADIRFSPLQFFTFRKDLDKPEAYKAIKPVIEPMLLQVQKYNNAKILDIGRGDVLSALYEKANELTTDEGRDWKTRIQGQHIGKVVSAIVNDTIKGFFIAKQLEIDRSLTHDDMVKYIDPLKPYLVLDYMKDSYNGKMAGLNHTASGKNEATAIHWVNKNPAYALVSGTIDIGVKGGSLTLSNVAQGDMAGVSSIDIYKNQFCIAVPVKKEGFYYISNSAWSFRIYLVPGDNLELSIQRNAKGVNYQVIKGSPENRSMNEWFKLSLPIMAYSNNGIFTKDTTSLESYSSVYNQKKAQVEAFKKNINTSNPYFNKLFRTAVSQDAEFGPFKFLEYKTKQNFHQPPIVPGVTNKYSTFYSQFIEPGKFSNTNLLNLRETREYMNLYTDLNFALLPQNKQKAMSGGDKLSYMVNLITNDTLKAHFINSKLGTVEINNLSEFNSTFQPIKKYLIFDESKKSYNEKFKEFISDTTYVGKQVGDFAFPDTAGKVVSLKSLRGKVVLIDVWATWCGPCKGQIPFLTQIEEEYHNRQDIAFISLSLDRLADNQKWVDFVKNGKLGYAPLKPGETPLKMGGIQLIDHSGKVFANHYAIYAIPRFILIDKQGKIIEIRLPVPEEHDAFTKYLEAALKQN